MGILEKIMDFLTQSPLKNKTEELVELRPTQPTETKKIPKINLKN